MRALVLGAIVAVLTSSGCGLVFQGFNQKVPILTDPVGAVATLDDETLQTPATFKVRRLPVWRVLRVELPGHGPACTVLRCSRNELLQTLDMLPLFLPLLGDEILGTLGRCEKPDLLKLPALPAGVPTYTLPDDETLIQAARGGADICAIPHQYDGVFLGHAQRIMVTAGPLAVEYEPLGTVDVVLPGFDRVRESTLTTFLKYGLIGVAVASGHAQREFSQANTSQANNALRAEALLRFGRDVGAVINVEYMTNPKNDVNATGLAVRLLGKDG